MCLVANVSIEFCFVSIVMLVGFFLLCFGGFSLMTITCVQHGHCWAPVHGVQGLRGHNKCYLTSLPKQGLLSLGNISRCIGRKILQEKLAAEGLANVKVKSVQMFHVYVCTTDKENC